MPGCPDAPASPVTLLMGQGENREQIWLSPSGGNSSSSCVRPGLLAGSRQDCGQWMDRASIGLPNYPR